MPLSITLSAQGFLRDSDGVLKGFFCSFEGLDGCGKTTQIKLLKQRLEKTGKEVVTFREPGCTKLGEDIRGVLLDPVADICDRSEVLLYLASRAQVTEDIIIPALNSGAIVLADRFADSSVAYQGYGRGLGAGTVEKLNDFAIKRIYPDLTILLDISVEDVFKRLENKSLDRLEKEKGRFWFDVKRGYDWLAEKHNDRYLRLDGKADYMTIHEEVWKALFSRTEIFD